MKKEFKKRGFTLVELLAVIVILAVIALIATPMILGVIEKSKKSAFQDSVYGVLDSVEYYMLEHNLNEIPTEGIEISELSLKNNSIKYGKITGELNNPNITGVSDGVYCAYGTRDQLIIQKGQCDTTNPSTPSLGVTNYQDGKMVITINEAKDEESGISKYICYYGTTDETKEIGVTKGNTCEIPMGEDYYGKVCAINGAGLEACSSSKQILKYLIKEGERMVSFTESAITNVIEGNDFIEYQKDKTGPRSGIYMTSPLSFSTGMKVYFDMELVEFSHSGVIANVANITYGITSAPGFDGAQDSTLKNYASKTLIRRDNSESVFNLSLPREIYFVEYQRADTNDAYIRLLRNNVGAIMDIKFYNLWIQY